MAARARILWIALAVGPLACAHTPAPPSASVARLLRAADAIGPISFEEDFFHAKLTLQALPAGAPARARLRDRMVDYLLAPLQGVDAAALRARPERLGPADDLERIAECLTEALGLVTPEEWWSAGGPRLDPKTHRRLVDAARLVVGLHGPRGDEQPVALALFALAALEPTSPEWPARLRELFDWLDVVGGIESGSRRDETPPPNARAILEGTARALPAPIVLGQLRDRLLRQQRASAETLRRPTSGGLPREALGQLLAEREELQGTAGTIAAAYLRAEAIAEAEKALSALAGRPGDDAELRQLLRAAAHARPAPESFLVLARRFLPRVDLLGGTAKDRVDAAAAMAALQAGLRRFPAHPEILILAARVARFLPAPLLALRYLEDADAALRTAGPPSDLQAAIAAERLDLSFVRLRAHIDPEHMEPALREADSLRAAYAAERRRFGATRIPAREADIDFEIAKGLVDAGHADRAEPLFQRAHDATGSPTEIALQLATLLHKRGDSAGAVRRLRTALEAHERAAPSPETIGYVEGHARLLALLGAVAEAAGHREEAQRAYEDAARGWERLMLEQLRRQNLSSSAEATMEVARLYYSTGLRERALERMEQAIEQNESRDQTYIDALAFLIQRGETDAALDVYRRAISRPSGVVSEYVKIYATLWIMDLLRRAGRPPEAAATAFLQRLVARDIHLRPPRASVWYTWLARYELGQVDFAALSRLADTAGKRAELYFYEAMRRLAEGRSEEAHELWTRVLETNMFSFFEFDMAARYLRTGAPTRPVAEAPAGATGPI